MLLDIYIDDKIKKIEVNDPIEENKINLKTINPDFFEDAIKYTEQDIFKSSFLYNNLYLTYFQGLESLFSLLASTIQAPYFFYGWIMLYQNKDLKTVIRKINQKENIKNSFNIKNVTWDEISKIIHPKFNSQEQKSFALIWEKLAKDFLSTDYQNAYNSLKHGIRVNKNSIARMKLGDIEITGSKYGFSFGNFEKQKNGNKLLKYKTLCFDPNLFELTFEFIRMTLINVKSFLSIINQKGKIEVEQYIIKEEFKEKIINFKDPELLSMTTAFLL